MDSLKKLEYIDITKKKKKNAKTSCGISDLFIKKKKKLSIILTKEKMINYKAFDI